MNIFSTYTLSGFSHITDISYESSNNLVLEHQCVTNQLCINKVFIDISFSEAGAHLDIFKDD